MSVFTVITSIDAPSSAIAGSTVNVTAYVRNASSQSRIIWCFGIEKINGVVGTRFIMERKTIAAGKTAQYTGSTVMPTADLRIDIYTYYEDSYGTIHEDDEKYRFVSLSSSTPEARGFHITNYGIGVSTAALERRVNVFTTGIYTSIINGVRYFYDSATDKWYLLNGVVVVQEVRPLEAYMFPAPKVVEIKAGDKLRIIVGFDYIGPPVSGAKIDYKIGTCHNGGAFDEKLSFTNTINLVQAGVINMADITIPSNVDSSWNAIYAKIHGGSPQVPVEYYGFYDALSAVGPSEFSISSMELVSVTKV